MQYVNRSLVQNHIIKVNDPEIAEQRWMKQMEWRASGYYISKCN